MTLTAIPSALRFNKMGIPKLGWPQSVNRHGRPKEHLPEDVGAPFPTCSLPDPSATLNRGGTTRTTRACDGREWGGYVGDLRHRGRDPGDLACMRLHHWMRDHLPFGHDLPRLGWQLDRGHGLNPTMSCRH